MAARVAVMSKDLAYVEVGDDDFVARFGPWIVRTPLTNVVSASVSGPYRWWRVVGPARLSFADRGLTFATNTRRGVCITFGEPVSGIEFTGSLRHPGLTVTVDDVDGLVQALDARQRTTGEITLR